MARSVQLTNYTDFDRLLGGKNFFLTLIGTGGAFVLSYLQIYIPIPLAPYNVNAAYAIMMIVAIYTANFASSIFVAIGGSLGLVGVDGNPMDFILTAIIINVLTMMILGFYSDRLRLVMHWNRLYYRLAALFSIGFIATGILWNPYAQQYRDAGINTGSGNDLGTGFGIDVLDLAVLGGCLLLILIFAFLTRGQILLQSGAVAKYRIFGGLFFLIGQAATVVPMVLYLSEGTSEFSDVAVIPYHLTLIDDLFSHSVGKYAIFADPFSIFFVMAITVTFTSIGLILLRIAKHGGNMEGMKGGSNVIFFAPSLVYFLYFVLASYSVQNLIAPGGLFISVELFGLFATMIWISWFVYTWIARIVLFILDRF
ncbi:MAG: hypothetical protein ACXAE3_08940 [Candidatus Kariarchaeaceae archaeon]|jgi:hypothetical protein